jgi:predicted transglutaminase-like cysteine proteinase
MPVTATSAQLATLQRANAQWNAVPYAAVPVDDAADDWIDAPEPGKSWECRDYVLAKAKTLREWGWPVGDMSVVLCWTEPEPATPGATPAREYHAVLGCRAGGEVYILDNRVGTVYPWQSPPYPYVCERQQIAGSLNFRDASGGLV